MPKYASSDLVKFGLLAESTEGVLATSAAYPVILTDGISVEFGSEIVSDPTIVGAGEPIDARTIMRRLSLTTPAHLRYGDCRTLIAAALRDVYPSETTIVGSTNIDVLTGGTHLDGTTGPQLRATGGSALTLFNNLISYGGVNATTHPRGGAEGLMAKLSGSAQAANNQWRRIKAVWKDGTNSFIDFFAGYAGGSSGAAFGAPVVGTTGESITIRVGAAVRNRFTGSGVKSFSGLWQFSDMATNAKWQAARGLVAGDLSLSWQGKQGATLEVPWVGYGSEALAATDPTGQGFADSNAYTDMLIGGEDLVVCAIVTDEPIVLSGLNLTGFQASIASNNAAIEDVCGTDEVTGVRRGSHVPTGTINYYLVDDARAEKLSQLGARATRKRGTIDVLFRDGAGNHLVAGFLSNEFAPTGPSPGTGGNTVAGALTWSGRRLTNTSRSVVFQEFAV